MHKHEHGCGPNGDDIGDLIRRKIRRRLEREMERDEWRGGRGGGASVGPRGFSFGPGGVGCSDRASFGLSCSS